ncbi:MAG: hypothetical protein PQJ47_01760 [Sphaerochaetaceae bacterium]|nr:hypothetical protein [Sphaerochaetaceae bacterium]
MEFIKLFIIGSLGYLLSGLYDAALVNHRHTLKKVLFPGFFVTAVPYMLFFVFYTSPLSFSYKAIIIILLLLFLLLLVYSVFLELLLFSDKNTKLFTKGTYSISRHPGFIWYTMINILIGIYFQDINIAVVCAGLTLDNLILITVEDRCLFPRLFGGYEEYKKTTPFILSLRGLKKKKG